MIKIDHLFKFVKFTNKFRKTQRGIFALDDNRMENDVEHSYQLALIAWYIIESEKLKLDANLAIQYALVHDLEESITGDKFIFDTVGRLNKDILEEKARKKIEAAFPNWKAYKKLSINYRALRDEESRFVNGLDKVLPVINIYLDGGKTWKQEDITLEMIIKNKREKTKVHPISENLWHQIEKKLIPKELKLFGKLSTKKW